MKKLIITLLTLASFSYMNAQEDEIRFGAKAGLNIATLSGDDIDGLDSKIGFHIGGVVEISISETFAVQPELLFSTQGAKRDSSVEDFNSENVLRLNYLNIPIMAKYYVIEGLSIQAGPQIGILLSAENEFENTSFGTITEEGTDDIKDDLKSIDFGLNFGLGYQLESGIFFDGRYNLGLSNLNEDEDDGDIQNSVFQFSVGYKF